ncbi:DUF2332 family protein [uncultured Tateyamaria sp.]|uniref:DUF2332 domain-containing protein n=1 Tax=uncultured Tateyamaria sp. TaxID=455651 RepID=UPI00261AADF9|nr:DUF2332 family protein [uncultured Tateyamaria sp.]
MSLLQAFRDQSDTCTRMGSPLMGRVLRILAENWDADSALGQKMAQYQGDIGPAGHSLPLRICGGLHALVLQDRDAGLRAAYPPNTSSDAQLEEAVLIALKTHQDFLIDWTQSPPQTNEVRRSAALMAMAHVTLSHFDRPIVLSELGASGGLNLMWDHFALDTGSARLGPKDAVLTLEPDWTGAAPQQAYPQVVNRSGVDLNPLNPNDPADLLRLTAYLWADQPHRLALTKAAASVMDALVEKGDAINWLATRLEAAPEGHLHIIQHTVAWQYFPAEAQKRGTDLIEAAGARATPTTPLAWMQMETDGDATGAIGAALTLRLWPGDLTLHLGRADFHGRWIKWAGRPAARRQLRVG